MMRIRLNQPGTLSMLRQSWRYLLIEPAFWLFLCFFQPANFSAQYEQQLFSKRVVLMLRLALPLFLFLYPFALIFQLFTQSCALACAFDQTNVFLFTIQATLLGMGCGLVAGVLGDIGLGITLCMALGITGIVTGNIGASMTRGIGIAVALGLVGGTSSGRRWGITRGIVGSLLGGLGWASASFILSAIASSASGIGWFSSLNLFTSLEGDVFVATLFFLSYMLGYYRLLLYPVSGLSAWRAYQASRRNPLRVFVYLHNSSLYWDECVFLPLPSLRQTLAIAAKQDVQLALQEIAFIFNERPQQYSAAMEASLEIALLDLETREIVREVARAESRLNAILPQDRTLLDPRWVTPFARLTDASREAARYCGPLNWQSRRNALREMLSHLEKIYPDTTLLDRRLSEHLDRVVTNWRAATRYEQERIAEQGSEYIGQIDNPYHAGEVLQPDDSLFVGRHDIVRQLSEALGRRGQRPLFLLNGERRMGKSSILKQLPSLLGALYIPIVYNLQTPGLSSSVEALLREMAEEVYQAVTKRGITIDELERTQLHSALLENEAAVYLIFNAWLDNLERVLSEKDRTLLILFDEFEKLEEASLAGYLNLNLLLDWFRSTVQNRLHISFLFSGVQTFSEVGPNWASYFVNAQTLKVGFLQAPEARNLILHPTPSFPGQEIFGQEVVEEIIRQTGGHPFLIQAVCSALIDDLNLESRAFSRLQDVKTAVDQVLDSWWDTYFRDLWKRSSQEQRICLTLLKDVGEADISSLVQQSSLAEQAVRQTLQALDKRDLITYERNVYRLASPIFYRWVQRSATS